MTITRHLLSLLVLLLFFSCQNLSKIYTDEEIKNILKNDLNFYKPTFKIYENSIKVRNLGEGKYHVIFQGEYNSSSVYSGLQEIQIQGKEKYSSKNIEGVGYNIEQ